MSVAAVGIVATGGAIAELVILSLGGFVLFRRWGNTFAESCAYGIVATLMTLAVIFRSAFLLNLPAASWVIEGLVTALAVAFIVRRRTDLRPALTVIRTLWSQHPLMCSVIGIVWGYLFLLALILPADPIYWESLGRVLVFERHLTLLPAGISSLADGLERGVASTNSLILPHLFLRCRGDQGLGILGLAAYLSLGFSVYALSRRYAWPATAFTIAVIVLGMPRVVYQATSPGYDIVPAAAALFCLLAVFRSVESPNARDLYLLLLGLLFMVSEATLEFTFPLVLFLLAGIVLFRRHGMVTWWHLLTERSWSLLLIPVPALILSPLWPLAQDLLTSHGGGSPWMPAAGVYNPDGLQGAAANAMRYLLQSIDVTAPVEDLLDWSIGFSMNGLLQKAYDTLVTPIFDGRGAATAFHIFRGADGRLSWYGPFGFALVIPAVAYAVRRAPRRLKAVSVALVGYFFLVALIPAWQPGNVRYFDVFFLCGSVCTAFFLPPWRVSRRGRRLMMAVGAGLLVYAALFNEHKPAFAPPLALATRATTTPEIAADPAVPGRTKPAGSIWTASDWGRNRFWAAPQIFGDERLEKAIGLVAAPERLAVIFDDPSLIYPFLKCFPSAPVLSQSDITPPLLTQLRSDGIAYLMFVDCSPPGWVPEGGGELLWQAHRDAAKLPGALVRLP